MVVSIKNQIEKLTGIIYLAGYQRATEEYLDSQPHEIDTIWGWDFGL